jgi:hypothetical protein
MSNVSMLSPAAGGNTVTCGGFQPSTQRQYVPGAGNVVSVAIADDVVQLQGRGWIPLPGSGTTAQRPTSLGGGPLTPGATYVDSTISKTITWDGSAWRDTSGAVV